MGGRGNVGGGTFVAQGAATLAPRGDTAAADNAATAEQLTALKQPAHQIEIVGASYPSTSTG